MSRLAMMGSFPIFNCKQDLDRAEKLLAKQLEEQQAAASS